MRGDRRKVYCAGPLFNAKEREEMLALATALEQAGFETFLPQRDGLELMKCVEALVEKGYEPPQAHRLMAEAIFALDVFQVLHGCQAVLANLNGRVPDEGTVAEAAMAWSRGKVVVAYKADHRTAFGGQDNPLVTGLFGFRLSTSIEDAVRDVGTALAGGLEPMGARDQREEEICHYESLGGVIWEALQRSRAVERIVEVIVGHATEVAIH